MYDIHITPTNDSCRLHMNGEGNLVISLFNAPKSVINGYHMYITSNDEIFEGCWCYSIPRGKVFKVGSISMTTTGVILTEDIEQSLISESYGKIEVNENDCRKIILTTDKKLINDGITGISDRNLESIVNSGATQVKMKRQLLSNDGNWKEVLLPSEWEVDTKVRYIIEKLFV